VDTAGVISRVRAIFGDSAGVVLKDEHIVAWINDAQLDIARETEYKVLTDSTNDASDFIGGVEIENMLLLRRVAYGSKPLALVDKESIDRMGVYSASGTTPQAYYMDGESIFLFPEPSATDTTTVNISYVGAPTDLATSSSDLDIPIRFHTDLVNFCIARAHERNENWAAARTYDERFRANVAQRKFETQSQDDTFHTVGPDIMDNDPYFSYE
jgi:hypothetical protein